MKRVDSVMEETVEIWSILEVVHLQRTISPLVTPKKIERVHQTLFSPLHNYSQLIECSGVSRST